MNSYELSTLLALLVEQGGSDLHLSVGSPPRLRVDGSLVELEGPDLTPADTQMLAEAALDGDQLETLKEDLELDLSFAQEGSGRFRANIFRQQGAVGAVFRAIPERIPSFEDLGLPRDTCEKISNLRSGLVLITGATGSGKSTSLAAMIDHVNRTRSSHIVTIEDPIEFTHSHRSCVVTQREVGGDTHSFGRALKSVLRQDPDVVLVGELRDLETIEAAMTMAETGHLTFGTLHTSDAVQTIHRVMDVFPAHQQTQVRTQLSFSLEAVISQQLLPHASGKGRVLAAEVLRSTPALRALIREGRTHQIASCIQTGSSKGMCTMAQALFQLVEARKITISEAEGALADPSELRSLMRAVGA
jgi:twitching motility protein PilT